MSNTTLTIINVTDYRQDATADVIWRLPNGQQSSTRLIDAEYTEAQAEAFSDAKLVEILNRAPVEE